MTPSQTPSPSPNSPAATNNDQVPQRWAIHPWGETMWTYMQMWAPKKLENLLQQYPALVDGEGPFGVAPTPEVMFHELGAALCSSSVPAPPAPQQQMWRTEQETPPPLRLTGPRSPIVVDCDPPGSRRLLAPTLENRTPLIHVDYPVPRDPSHTVLQQWSEVAAMSAHVHDLILQAEPQNLLKLVPLSQRRQLQPKTPPAPEAPTPQETREAQTLNEEIEAGFAELRLSPSEPIRQWLLSVAAWHATLTIRYSPHNEPARPLRQAVMAHLLSTPVPATSLPPIPPIPEAAERLPEPPSQRLYEQQLQTYTPLLPVL